MAADFPGWDMEWEPKERILGFVASQSLIGCSARGGTKKEKRKITLIMPDNTNTNRLLRTEGE